jgi:hypothetical protein
MMDPSSAFFIKIWSHPLQKPNHKCLRIEESMRYNDPNGELFPNKTVRTDVSSIYTHLTQPTEWTADWAGINYTNPLLLRPGGIPSGRFCLVEPDSRLGCPTHRRNEMWINEYLDRH